MTSVGRLGDRELRRLLEVGRGLVSDLDLESVLRRVLEVARELTCARYAALGVLDERKQELERFIYLGIDEQTRRAIGHLPRGRGVLGELIRKPSLLRLRDVTAHPRSYGFPTAHPPMTSFLGAPILIGGEAFGNLYLTEKAGAREFDQADEESIVVLADWAAVAIENARLYEQAESRRLELERAVVGLEATTTIARALGAETELHAVLDLIAKRGRALVEAAWALILIRGQESLVVAAAAGELPSDPTGLRVPIAGSVPGRVLRSLGPERIADVSSGAVRVRLKDIGLEPRAEMVIPLVYRGRAVGVLVTADKLTGDGSFSDEDERLMLSFAASAATAIATAQSVEAARLQYSIESAERERKRWARELHDETLQELGAVNVVLDTALQSGKPELLEHSAQQVVERIQYTIKGLQSIITELRPAALDELGTRPAIEALVERTRSHSGIEVSLEIDLAYESGRAPTRHIPQVEEAVYRLIQEALNNTVKHSSAASVVVAVLEDETGITISVADDGSGFDPEATEGGFGLVSMRERASLVGGELSVESRPGEGTTVRARIPTTRTEDGEHPLSRSA